MGGTKLTKEELEQAARDQYIDPDQSYEELREAVEFHTCKWCNDEYVGDIWDGFCSDGCQVQYINEFYR